MDRQTRRADGTIDKSSTHFLFRLGLMKGSSLWNLKSLSAFSFWNFLPSTYALTTPSLAGISWPLRLHCT